MRRLDAVRPVRAGLLLAALVACSRSEAPHPDTSTAARVPFQVVESPGALASRREAQESFDAVREALVRKDFEGAATALSDAATFYQAEARTAPVEAKPALDRASEVLDSLAARVAHGEAPAPVALDRVFANAHGAEVWLHLMRAHAAVLKRDNVRAGEELVMSVDHLERAAKDASLQADSLVLAAIADARSLAGEMLKGMEAVPDETARVTDELERAVDRIGTIPARAAASSAVKPQAPEPCHRRACGSCLHAGAAPAARQPMPCRR